MVINTFNDCDIISTDSEECPSLLDGTNAFTGPRTSTPVKEEHVIDLHTLNFDDSHSQPSTVQSSSFPDSGSITPPDFSALIHSSLTFEKLICYILHHRHMTWKKVVVVNQMTTMFQLTTIP